MALQTSGAISLSDIQTEFGGSNPIALSEYYGVSGGIPASGEISIGDFYGASSGWTVTQGTNGNIFGYDSLNSIGSISPTTLNSADIVSVYYYESVVKGSTIRTFQVRIAGNRAQSFFASISESSLGTLTSSSATYSYVSTATPPYTSWYWSLASTPSNWDGSGNLSVVFA